jgi:shikimate kinase
MQSAGPSREGRTLLRPDDLILMGARGCGKSTIGAALSNHIEARFDDLDDLVLARFPEVSVQQVFDARGETAWRDAECETFLHWMEGTGRRLRILALGGGTPMIDTVASQLRAAGTAGTAWIVYLEAPAAVLADRLRRTMGDRPSLTGVAPADEMDSILAHRASTYQSLATARLDATQPIHWQIRTLVDWLSRAA